MPKIQLNTHHHPDIGKNLQFWCKRDREKRTALSSDIRGVVFIGYFQTPQITTMAGCIFSAPSKKRKRSGCGKYFRWTCGDQRWIMVPESFYKVSPLYCLCGALAWPTGVSSEERVAHRKITVICDGMCLQVFNCVRETHKYRWVIGKLIVKQYRRQHNMPKLKIFTVLSLLSWSDPQQYILSLMWSYDRSQAYWTRLDVALNSLLLLYIWLEIVHKIDCKTVTELVSTNKHSCRSG